MTGRSEIRAGIVAMAPMLLGAIPFGLAAGAVPVADGLGGWTSVGLSTFVFAGASQLAAADVLSDGGSALVAIVAALTINLRMVLYSASLAPYLARESTARRLGTAYLLTDQAYALSVDRWSRQADTSDRMPFYFAGAVLLWVAWQAATVVGVLVGASVPDSVPLDFAIPLVFLVLLIPAISTRPAAVAAAVGGGGAVVAAQMGAGHLSVVVGAAVGILAGTLADLAIDRAARGSGA